MDLRGVQRFRQSICMAVNRLGSQPAWQSTHLAVNCMVINPLGSQSPINLLLPCGRENIYSRMAAVKTLSWIFNSLFNCFSMLQQSNFIVGKSSKSLLRVIYEWKSILDFVGENIIRS